MVLLFQANQSTMTSDIPTLINEARTEIWEIAQQLKDKGDRREGNDLIIRMAACGDHFDWLELREEALGWIEA